MNKKQRRKSEAIRRKAIARGMTVVCRRCCAREQVKPGDYYKGTARCSACGGGVDRVHAPGKWDSKPGLDGHRVVPRKLGCKPSGGPT